MKAKYKRGKRIKSIEDFAKSKAKYYKVIFGNHELTRHRAFLESWQYHTIELFINGRRVFEAEPIQQEEGELKWMI